MAPPSRATLLNRIHRTLKKYYKPIPPSPQRSLMEQLLFACCLENSPYDAAEQAFEALRKGFFDWNEVRVSTIRELAEELRMLPYPESAASHLKRILQNVFETSYSFELELLKKQNLGQAVQRLKKVDGTTDFHVAYVTQANLGGHAIPIDRGALDVLAILGAISPEEAAHRVVPGLERAIPKNKGVEFGSLLHQLGAEFVVSPHSPGLHKILLEISPDAKSRWPKKSAKKSAEPAAPPAVALKAPETPKSTASVTQPTHKPAADTKGGEASKKPAAPKKKPPESKPHAPAKAKANSEAKSGPKPAKKKSAATATVKPKPR